MIEKVDNASPQTLGDLELKQNDPRKPKKLKDLGPMPGDPTTENTDDDNLSSPPVSARYLGKRLDIIA